MFILKKGHQPGVYMPLRALFLVHLILIVCVLSYFVKKIYIKCHNHELSLLPQGCHTPGKTKFPDISLTIP